MQLLAFTNLDTKNGWIFFYYYTQANAPEIHSCPPSSLLPRSHPWGREGVPQGQHPHRLCFPVCVWFPGFFTFRKCEVEALIIRRLFGSTGDCSREINDPPVSPQRRTPLARLCPLILLILLLPVTAAPLPRINQCLNHRINSVTENSNL